MQNHILKVSRLEGLTDGIFAIAMTILVLNLNLPADSIHLETILISITLLYMLPGKVDHYD